MTDHSDLIARASRMMAAGWRGNPHMSGDDRNFMTPSMRRRHDAKVREVVEFVLDEKSPATEATGPSEIADPVATSLSEARAAPEILPDGRDCATALSEAREEIERLRGALLVVRPVVAGLIDAQYNVETWGLKGRLAKLDYELRRERVCEVCSGDCSAANPPPSYCPERDDFSALENSKARLADANTNPASPDLSSLRKGAEL